MSAKLINATVRDLVAPAAGNTITWDSTVKGFGIRCTAGGAKAFVLDYRVAGRQRRYTIGSWPDWSTPAARTEATRLKREIDRGRDPMAERHHARHAPTLADLCDRYLVEHVDVHNKRSTGNEVRRTVDKIIKPMLGRLKLDAIQHADIERFHRDLRSTPRQANYAVAMISKMMNLAERWQLRPLNSNPCRHLRRYPEPARDRYPLPDELERIGIAMRELEAEGTLLPEDAICVRLLALVGCRLGEAVALDLSDIDFRTGAWALPDAKAGKRVVMLGAPALALLAGWGRTTGRAFVRASGKLVTASMIEHAWIRIRTRAGIPDLRCHDLRHGVGSYAGAAGLNAFMIRDLLGHKTMAMTGRYVSRHVDPLRAAADTVAGKIAAALDGSAAEIVPIRQRR